MPKPRAPAALAPVSATAPATAPAATHGALPLLAAALAAALFIGMDATVKTLTPRHDAVQLTFLRFAAGLLFALPLWAWFRTPMPARSRWGLHLLRSALLLAALGGWFHALSLLPLVQAVAVGYTAPLFISLLAMWLLKERPSRWIWAALGLGVLGVAVALLPELAASADAGSGRRVEGLLAAAASAVCYSGVVVLARLQAQSDPLWTILLVQNSVPTVVLAAALGLGGHWPAVAPTDWAPVLLVGLLATGGLLAITWAFTHIEATRAAPLEYTGLVWAGLLGYMLFGEVPSGHALVSASLIVAGSLLLLRK